MIGWDAELHKRTLEQATLSLVGPQPSERRRRRRLPVGAEHAIAAAPAVLRSCAPPAGEDVICTATDAGAVRAALGAPERRRATRPTRVLRVEAGVPRYGAELDDSVIPQEAGLNDAP